MYSKERFIHAAEALKPELFHSKVNPQQVIEVTNDQAAFQGWGTREIRNIESLEQESFGKNDSFILDFGDHCVGYLSMAVKASGNHPDAPLSLKLVFGEMPCEIAESFDSYEGWLSRSWLQEETLVLDELPAEIRLPRRYSFRYVKIRVLDTSNNYKVRFSNITCTTVTSGDAAKVGPLPDHIAEDVRRMDAIAVKTLQDCMQTVFEDGPKRDRRLWIGDLRLQALTNYYTFKNAVLVKRCLLLFAGFTHEKGQVVSDIFEKPALSGDHILFIDYSLLFVPTLSDYVEFTGDRSTLADLWPVALKQIHIALSYLDERSIMKDDGSYLSFIDWNASLDHQTAMQGVLLYCMKSGLTLARQLNDADAAAFLEDKIKILSEAAIKYLWDGDQRLFISGRDRQISWASQVWMVLAEVFDQEENGELLDRVMTSPPSVQMTTPYMVHHLIEALVTNDRMEAGLQYIRGFWGGMMEQGADCFWEAYLPEDEWFSPYGSHLINSYCHAWSCTPAYFIRKYLVS